MRSMSLLLASIGAVLCIGAAKGAPPRLPPDNKVILQADAPVKILTYQAAYQPGGNYSREGIVHNVEYQNISDKPIVAVEFGLVAFDVWNEFLDHTGGVTIETVAPQATQKGTWVASRYADFSFHTGVAYVSKVRFDTGDVWKADLNVIVAELKKIQADFDAANLKKRALGK